MSKKKKDKSKKLDEFHYHEATDRAYVFTNLVDEHLLEHPAIQKHKDVKKKVQLAIDLLADAYQMISGYGYVLFDEKNKKKK